MSDQVNNGDGETPLIATRNIFVTVLVTRNEQTPVFQNLPCSATLSQNNNQFFQLLVTATDGDAVVS